MIRRGSHLIFPDAYDRDEFTPDQERQQDHGQARDEQAARARLHPRTGHVDVQPREVPVDRYDRADDHAQAGLDAGRELVARQILDALETWAPDPVAQVRSLRRLAELHLSSAERKAA